MPTTRRLSSLRRALTSVVCVAAVAFTGAACGSGGSSGAAAAPTSTKTTTTSGPQPSNAAGSVRSGTVTVHIKDYAFSPADLTVKAGTKLTFVNDDGVTHTATAPDGAFDTGDIQPGKSVTVTAKAPTGGSGAVPYICSIHQFMKGSITVEP